MQKKDTIKRYILFQIPELALTIVILYIIKYFYEYPYWILWLIVAFSILKDVILFNYTWKSYIVHPKEDYARVKGKLCTARGNFNKCGQVVLNGEIWKVRVDTPVKKGDTLRISDVKGLVLFAEKVI